MKKLCLAICLVVACKSSSTSQPSTQPPPMTEQAPPAEPTSPPPAAPDSTPPAPSPDPTQTKPTPPANPPPANPPPATTALPKMGETCGAGDACAQGLTCVKYYGIAGARGPEFKSCEVKCTGKSACPAGTKCVTIADGPGQVCRAPMGSP